MGEILIACFIGVWLTAANVVAYIQLKKDFKKKGNK